MFVSTTMTTDIAPEMPVLTNQTKAPASTSRPGQGYSPPTIEPLSKSPKTRIKDSDDTSSGMKQAESDDTDHIGITKNNVSRLYLRRSELENFCKIGVLHDTIQKGIVVLYGYQQEGMAVYQLVMLLDKLDQVSWTGLFLFIPIEPFAVYTCIFFKKDEFIGECCNIETGL